MKLEATNLDQKVRETNSYNQDLQERLKYSNLKLKEAELEKELLLAEKNNFIECNDQTSIQI
jgi:hypothetical protein